MAARMFVALLAVFTVFASLARADRSILASVKPRFCVNPSTWDYHLLGTNATFSFDTATKQFVMTLYNAKPTVYFRDNSGPPGFRAAHKRLTTTQLVRNLAIYQQCSSIGTATLQVLKHSTGVFPMDAAKTLRFKVYSISADPCREQFTLKIFPIEKLYDSKEAMAIVTKNAKAGLPPTKTTGDMILVLEAPQNDTLALPSFKYNAMNVKCPPGGTSSNTSRGRHLLEDASTYCNVQQQSDGVTPSDVASKVNDIVTIFQIPGVSTAVDWVSSIMDFFTPSDSSLSLNAADVWNCISSYVEKYVQKVINQVMISSIRSKVQGILAAAAQLKDTASPAEYESKFASTLSMIVATGTELFDTAASLPVQVAPELLNFGSTFVAFRAAEAWPSEYKRIYGSPPDANKVSEKVNALIQTIQTYQQYIDDAFNTAWAWRSSVDNRTVTQESSCADQPMAWGCGDCMSWVAKDAVTGWNYTVEQGGQCPGDKYTSSAGDAWNVLWGEWWGSQAHWYISMRLALVAPSLTWPLTVPNKTLALEWQVKNFTTLPYGNCGVCFQSQSAASCCKDTSDGEGLVRFSNPADNYKHNITSINIWQAGNNLVAVEPFFNGASAGVQGSTTGAQQSTLSLASDEYIVRLQLWASWVQGPGEYVVGIAGLNITTNKNRGISFGQDSLPADYDVDLSNVAGGAWACGVNARVGSTPFNLVTALGFDWCWMEPVITCTSSNPSDASCNW
eukprot:CAMPEP_0202902732 /NCGR_PEP_ID=MMETSP1392-20130828/17022_1 /ASSEMBLY_ACC=CAM_ASM_000868 /TAXON_ID=225041 /ORGANISM="Chlamydomonas chlamydogama, Strain SAG 11-48b" /LENGTH=731 /DNA_ID=CAMNT_0049589539 /DNA_START=108 /DNA_END=2300 /DNA_ORIENTATION=-